MTLTKKHLELFKKECKKHITDFELNNWEVSYTLTKLDSDTFSQISRDLEGRCALIELDKTSDVASIKSTAKHEILHLLLGRMSELAKKRHATEEEIYDAEEELVRKLEKIIK